MLEVRDLRKRFHSRAGSVEAVRGVSFTVNAGEVLAFLGPNGAGKTTTIKMTAGLVRPDEGSVTIDGFSLHTQPGHAMVRLGAVLEGSRNLYWRLTVLENLIYWASMRRVPLRLARSRALALLERVGLRERAHNTVQTLSRGMQQKVALCQALMHQPRLLLLDEPTLGLDLGASEGIKALVKELAQEGTAVLLTTHQLDIAQELSHRVAMIRGGRLILDGKTADVLQQYSQPVYTITGIKPWPDHLRQSILGLKGEVVFVSPDRLQFTPLAGDSQTLYELLERLKPHPLLSVERHRADLVEVFQQVMQEEAL